MNITPLIDLAAAPVLFAYDSERMVRNTSTRIGHYTNSNALCNYRRQLHNID